MIRGLHGLLYSSQPEALRAFLRDKLQLPYSDVGEGWLIFDLPEGDLGVHPTDGDDAQSGVHDVSFYTDDVAATVAELQGRGVVFDHPIENHGYGLVTHFTMPGDVRVQLYQPKYRKRARASAAAATPKRKPARARTAKSARGRKARGAKRR
jgi:hypothetical protein